MSSHGQLVCLSLSQQMCRALYFRAFSQIAAKLDHAWSASSGTVDDPDNFHADGSTIYSYVPLNKCVLQEYLIIFIASSSLQMF